MTLSDPEKMLVEKVLAYLFLMKTKPEDLASRTKYYLKQASKIAKGADLKGMLQYAADFTKTLNGKEARLLHTLSFSHDWREGISVKIVLDGLQVSGLQDQPLKSSQQ